MKLLWLTSLCLLACVHRISTKSRPIVIGHRGAAGFYPEHTVSGYQQAIADHADFIECDVFPTKDLQLICSHDPYLSPVTDVSQHAEFADRKRKLFIPDYGQHDDWFCFDFTLDELKTLRVKQRLDFRDHSFDGIYQIATFDEYVQVAKAGGAGIYPEIKMPEFFNNLPFMNGSRFEDLFLDALTRHGYTKKQDPCFVQSFSDEALRYIRNRTDLRLMIMVWLDEHIRGPYLNDSKLDEWSTLYYGLGAWKTQIVNYYDDQNRYKNWIQNQTGLLQEVTSTGLKLHLYTFRNEDRYLAWDFKQDPINEYLYFDDLGDIEAYFTDFPGTMHRAFEQRYGQKSVSPCPTSWASSLQSSMLLVTGFFLAFLEFSHAPGIIFSRC